MSIGKITSVQDLNNIKAKVNAALKAERVRLLLCCGNGCAASGADDVYKAFEEKLAAKGVDFKVEVFDEKSVALSSTGCQGLCQYGPLLHVVFGDKTYFYVKVTPDDVDEIIDTTVKDEKIVERLLFKDPKTGKAYVTKNEIPFYANQKPNLMTGCGVIDSRSLEEYIGQDGYQGIAKILGTDRKDVCKEVLDSGLRGRGGGGFPTGRKWMFTEMAKGEKKYVVCNGDEGDPGAFMDGAVMEGYAHALLEGMIIAGYAVGADEGYIYVRAEYPRAIKSLRRAIAQCEECGLLGKNIMGSDFNFEIHIKEGAGAFVCGEETALIHSIEGQRGMPSPKPPFPANSGLWGKPTLINNVETYANVPNIIRNGAAWFRSYGTETSPGTKTFSVTGEVVNTGLIEIPMGTTIKKVVYDIGGGTRNAGKEFKAVQIGGPSGACLTKDHLDVQLDYDALKKVGAMVGSGGLVVLDESTCMVKVARFFMGFTQSESCGKCVLCREGTKRMLEILDKILAGEGELKDLDVLEDLALTVRDGSLCGLGKTAPNPVLSTLKYFRDEYVAHIVDKKCPAGQCDTFKTYSIDPEKCKGCGMCAKKCPVNAISGEVKSPYTIDASKCIKCGACADTCKFGAVTF